MRPAPTTPILPTIPRLLACRKMRHAAGLVHVRPCFEPIRWLKLHPSAIRMGDMGERSEKRGMFPRGNRAPLATGAGQGLVLAIAETPAEAGEQVILAGRPTARLQAAQPPRRDK